MLSNSVISTQSPSALLALCAASMVPTWAVADPSRAPLMAHIVYGADDATLPTAFSFTQLPGTRPTTAAEKAIGEIRSWVTIPANWDGEGAAAPIKSSLHEASSFVCALAANAGLVEPMLHASGRAGLFWQSEGMYADLEFLGSGRLAYYIEKGTNKHKGVVEFNMVEVPSVLQDLLVA